MHIGISQLGVYRALNGQFDGHPNPQAAERLAVKDERVIDPLDKVGQANSAREIERAQSLANGYNLVGPERVQNERDMTQMNGTSIDLAKFYLNLDSGIAPGPVPMRAEMAEQRYLEAMGMI